MSCFASGKFAVRRLDKLCLWRVGVHVDPDSKARLSLSSLYRILGLWGRETLQHSHSPFSPLRHRAKINQHFYSFLKSSHLLQATVEIITFTLFCLKKCIQNLIHIKFSLYTTCPLALNPVLACIWKLLYFYTSHRCRILYLPFIKFQL